MIERLREEEAGRLYFGSYVFFRGMHFEDRTHDKPRMLRIGGLVVGMSCKPECAVIMDYPDVSAVVLACLSNDSTEEPDHESHRRALQAQAQRLSGIVHRTTDHWDTISPFTTP